MLLRCQKQAAGSAYVTSLVSKVKSCVESLPTSLAKLSINDSTGPGADAKGQKNKKKKKKQGKKKEEEAKSVAPLLATKYYDAIFDDTILFPEGGGQPSDIGVLTPIPQAQGRGGDEKATDKAEETKQPPVINIVHVYRNDKGEAVHVLADSPVTEGEEVELQVDWNTRYDHMQQHSGQHLISAVAREMFGFNTVSWWLATKSADGQALCNIELDTPKIQPAQLQAIQHEVNRLIREAKPMNVLVFHSLEECAKHPYFIEHPEKLPTQELVHPLRVVQIPGVEYNKCCGTHLSSISELQMVHLVKTDKAKGNSRLYFLAGGRNFDYFQSMYQNQKKLNEILNTGPSQHAELVSKAQKELRAATKREKKLLSEHAALKAKQLVEEARAEGRTLALSHYREDASSDYLATLVSTVNEIAPDMCVLACTSPMGCKEGAFLLGGPADRVSLLGPQIVVPLEGRGGGRKGKFQGKAQRIDKHEEAYQVMLKALTEEEQV